MAEKINGYVGKIGNGGTINVKAPDAGKTKSGKTVVKRGNDLRVKTQKPGK